jgi:ADP-ribose pyrophosphatase YjhB (NUDIX family)
MDSAPLSASISSKKEREDIFALFIKKKEMRFCEIEKALNVRSNHLSYHLEKLVSDDILKKEDDTYSLTRNAEGLIPFFAHITGKEQGPLSIMTAAVIHSGADGDKICLLRREKRPYKGYWGVIGGKLKLHESIRETALRETKEETGIDCEFDRLASVLHERVKEDDKVKHSFVIFFCKLKAKTTKLVHSEEGRLEWFSIKDLPKNIIPSDLLMIEELLDGDFCAKDIIIEEKDGELKDMEVEHGGRL